MSSYEKLLIRILEGSSDANISFSTLCQLLHRFGVEVAIIFLLKKAWMKILNLQPKGSKAKPYQVKQVRNIILKYRLGGKGYE